MKTQDTFIGIDIGGTNTEIGLIDSSGQYLKKEIFSTHSKKPVSVFMSNLEKEMLTLFKINGYQPAGIGIGIPGGNSATGYI